MVNQVCRANTVVATILTVLVVSGCGSWKRVGSEPVPDSNIMVPRLFDPTTVYSGMGFVTHGDPYPFVASVHFLATAHPDSTLALISVSFSKANLSFVRGASDFTAEYNLSVDFRRPDGELVGRIADTVTVIASGFRATMSADYSVTYGGMVPLPSGIAMLSVRLEDMRTGVTSRAESQVTVPDFSSGPSLSSLIPILRAGTMRTDLASQPDLELNPRATVPFGTDTLLFYLESYRADPDAILQLEARSAESGEDFWSEEKAIEGGGELFATIIEIAPEDLQVGELTFRASIEGSDQPVIARALVSFSDNWIVSNFDDVLSLLRYFAPPAILDSLANAGPGERASRWREFWDQTDPDAATPTHEGLIEYFSLLDEANRLFREPRLPGWLTDRGEVFILLGRPDETFEPFSDPQSPVRIIRWTYTASRIVLEFVDQTGLGIYRLTDRSRADFRRTVNRMRRS